MRVHKTKDHTQASLCSVYPSAFLDKVTYENSLASGGHQKIIARKPVFNVSNNLSDTMQFLTLWTPRHAPTYGTRGGRFESRPRGPQSDGDLLRRRRCATRAFGCTSKDPYMGSKLIRSAPVRARCLSFVWQVKQPNLTLTL